MKRVQCCVVCCARGVVYVCILERGVDRLISQNGHVMTYDLSTLFFLTRARQPPGGTWPNERLVLILKTSRDRL